MVGVVALLFWFAMVSTWVLLTSVGSIIFEYMDVTISSSATSFHLVVLYRPPPSNKNKLTSSLFLDECSSHFEILTAGSIVQCYSTGANGAPKGE